MIKPLPGIICSYVLCGFWLLTAQEVIPAEDAARGVRRPSIGFRIEAFPYRLFDVKGVETSTTKPVADYKYTGATSSPKAAVAPTVEYRLSSHLTLGTELHFHHAQFTETTEIRSGRRDPNASTDDRKVTTIKQTNKANYWEFPFLAHYYKLRPKGILAHTYVSGGLKYRYIGRVRSGTEYSYADGSTDYNEAATKPTQTSQIGAVVGIGLRFIDDFNVKVAPEVRFVRWKGASFQGTSYGSVGNQLEVGLGFSF